MNKLISLGISLLILGIIYWTIDVGSVLRAFTRTDPVLLVVAVLMLVPIAMMTSSRLCWLVPSRAGLGLGQAIRLFLGSGVLNMILPAKMGDLAKFAFMRRNGILSGPQAFAIVVFEKVIDLLALLAWCAFGLLLFSGDRTLFFPLAAAIGLGVAGGATVLVSKSAARLFFAAVRRAAPLGMAAKLDPVAEAWDAMHGIFWRNRWFGPGVFAFSVLLWFVHLVQIWLFMLSLGAAVPLLSSLALTPLAILAGLLPVTFAGIGTRDAALIFLFRPFMNAGTGAAVGLLCTLRYVLPALGGLFFFPGLLAELQRSPDDTDSRGTIAES